MRFISQYPLYKFQARPMRQKALGDGGVEVTQDPIYCQFDPVHSGAMIYDNEVATAMQHFSFRGNTQHQDEATPSDPINRLSVFDTDEKAEAEGWSAEEKAMVETRLQELAIMSPDECLFVTSKPIEAPFPKYDVFDGDAEQLVQKLIEDGHDLEVVLHYERTFGEKRVDVIDALEVGIEMLKEEVVQA